MNNNINEKTAQRLDDLRSAIKVANLEIAALISLGELSEEEKMHLRLVKEERRQLKYQLGDYLDVFNSCTAPAPVLPVFIGNEYSQIAQVRELRSGRRQSIYGSKI